MAKYVKIKSPSSLLVPGKISHFLHYLGYFWQEAAASQSKGQNQNLIYPFTPARFLVNFLQKSLIRAFSSFVAIGHKWHFRKILTWIFKFGFFSWYHACIFEKNNLAFNVASISTNLYFLVFPFWQQGNFFQVCLKQKN